jgi:hypothetical protein
MGAVAILVFRAYVCSVLGLDETAEIPPKARTVLPIAFIFMDLQ